MKTLTKADLTEQLVSSQGIHRVHAKKLIEMFFHEIKVCLTNDEDVKISGFGNFELKSKSTRPGRNPKTGEEVAIAARKVVTFRPGQKLRQLIEDTPKPQELNSD